MKILVTFLLFLLVWMPRILCLCLTGFVLLLGDLVPAIIVFAVLILSWKWPWIGGLLFLLGGLAYAIANKDFDWVIFSPLFLTGTMFILSWQYRKEIEKAREDFFWGEEPE